MKHSLNVLLHSLQNQWATSSDADFLLSTLPNREKVRPGPHGFQSFKSFQGYSLVNYN